MKLVMSMVVRDEADVLEAQIAFHLNAGVDLVLATDHESTDGSADILESFTRDGYLRRIPVRGAPRDAAWRASMAALAEREYEANWLIDSQADEFWLPRAESLQDVLEAIPPRYGAVQAFARIFPPRPEDGRSFVERMTVREASPPYPEGDGADRLDWALRPIFRAHAATALGAGRESALDGIVPLRAWYPIEVLRFPLRSLEQAQRRVTARAGPPDARSALELKALAAHRAGDLAGAWPGLVLNDASLNRGLADGSLQLDERLSECLGRLELPSESPATHRYARPSDAAESLGLGVPTVVDDVAYAAECAAVREVDFEPLRERIAELESRIDSLESRLWPRIRRRIAGLARR